MQLKDKHVLITGGSSGLGAELARQLSLFNPHINLLARDEKQ